MQELDNFLKATNYQPVFNLAALFVGLAICVIVVVLLLHTLHILGGRSPLYKGRQPVKGWSKRVYSVGMLLIAILVVLLLLLGQWGRNL